MHDQTLRIDTAAQTCSTKSTDSHLKADCNHSGREPERSNYALVVAVIVVAAIIVVEIVVMIILWQQ